MSIHPNSSLEYAALPERARKRCFCSENCEAQNLDFGMASKVSMWVTDQLSLAQERALLAINISLAGRMRVQGHNGDQC
jgi:hypothetical protein